MQRNGKVKDFVSAVTHIMQKNLIYYENQTKLV